MTLRKTNWPMIRAALNMPSGMILGTAESWGQAAIIEAAAGADGAKLKTFSGVAYTGGKLSVGYGFPVVIDLGGLTAGAESIPALKDHDATQIVGHLTAEIGKRQIKVKGALSGEIDGMGGDAARTVAAMSANDFPWQMSVGVMPDGDKMEFIERGKSDVVNGKRVDGPAYVARAGTLVEVSFVAMGADSNTSGKVAASIHNGASDMTPFEKWLELNAWDKSKLSAAQLVTLEASFKAEIVKPEPTPAKPIEAANDPTAEIRAKASAEMSRIAKISEVAKDKPDIQAKAIAEGWDATKTELEVLRASRPSGPAIHAHSAPLPTTDIMACAMSRTLRQSDTEKRFKPETLEAADKQFRRGLGLKQMLLITAAANGMPVLAGDSVSDGNLRDVLGYAFGKRGIQAAFSTVSVSNILENVANKSLLEGYTEEDQSWREIAEIKPVSDFKDHKANRLLDDSAFEELSPTGEIAHGTLSDEYITYSADTFARMFVITRTMIINDDLGAFNSMPRRLGQGRARKFNNVFWTAFLNNSTFFTSALTNYMEGSTTNLGTDGVGLGLGVKTFRKMTSPSGDGAKRVGNGMTPSILLVPPELEGIADALYQNQNLGSVASSSANIYARKYRPVVQNRLSEAAFTGYSSTGWYLFGSMMKPMWAAFLNGNESPTVESADADFNTLGIQFRGYHDFGAGLNEKLAGIKSKGAA
jgi:hypothetical protein